MSKPRLENVTKAQLETLRDRAYPRDQRLHLPTGESVSVGVLCDMALALLSERIGKVP